MLSIVVCDDELLECVAISAEIHRDVKEDEA